MHPLDVNHYKFEEHIQAFLGYMIDEEDATSNVCDKALMALRDFFKLNNINWSRSPILKLTMKGIRRTYPGAKYRKKPIPHWFIWWMWNSYYNPNNFLFFGVLVGILMGYWLGCRVGEYTVNDPKDMPLPLVTLSYNPKGIKKKKYAKELVINLHKSKTNQLGERPEILT